MEGFIRLPEVTVELCDTREFSFAHAKMFNLSFTAYAINHMKLSSHSLENPDVITNLAQPSPAN